MGHTRIHARGDCIRRIPCGEVATVDETRIPRLQPWGASRKHRATPKGRFFVAFFAGKICVTKKVVKKMKKGVAKGLEMCSLLYAREKEGAMKRLEKSFAVVIDGKEVDRFDFYIDSNNHANISNKSGCLFSGYSLEAVDKWVEIVNDMMVATEMLDGEIVSKK